MQIKSIIRTIETRPVACLTGATLCVGALAFGLAAVAEDEAPKSINKATQQSEKACPRQHADNQEEDWRPLGPRGEGRAYGRPDGPPPRRGEFGPRGPRGYGRPEGPPPPRGAFGPQGQERDFARPPRPEFGGPGRGPERFARRGEGGHRPPPPRGEFDKAWGDDFEPRRLGGDRGPRGFRGPGRPPGPPAFSDIDSDGSGSISPEEFKAFHERRSPAHRPRGPRGEGRPRHDGPPPPPSAE